MSDPEIVAPRRPADAAPRTTTGRVRHLLTTRDGWLRLAELVIGEWASTLRAGFLLLAVVAAVVVTIGVVFGFGSALIGAVPLLVVYLIGRRRGSANR